jgi:nucleoside-diphosphate-sugar epimerase
VSPAAEAPRRILVTGATGFVGRALCLRLLERGYLVGAAVRDDPARAPAGTTPVRVGEVGPDTDWSEALKGRDAVVHLAAHAHRTAARDRDDEEPFLRVNAGGTLCLARAVRAAPEVRRVVFVSSVAAVRCAASPLVDERTDCDPPDPYGRSKRAAEAALRETLTGPEGPDWTVLRPPLVYGPGNPGNMARLLAVIRSGLPLPLGAVRNRRSFLFVGNLVDAVERCLWHPAASRRAFPVSDGEDLSTVALVRRLARTAERRVRLVPVPLPLLRFLARLGDVAQARRGGGSGFDSYALERLCSSLVVDASALREATGWAPPFTLDEGLAITLAPPPGVPAGAQSQPIGALAAQRTRGDVNLLKQMQEFHDE